MTDWQQWEQCLVCSDSNRTTFSLQEVLLEFDGFTVAEILDFLNLLTISDAEHLSHSLCLKCVSKMQTCFDFKVQCSKIEKALKARTQKLSTGPRIQSVFSLNDHSTVANVNLIDKRHSVDHFNRINGNLVDAAINTNIDEGNYVSLDTTCDGEYEQHISSTAGPSSTKIDIENFAPSASNHTNNAGNATLLSSTEPETHVTIVNASSSRLEGVVMHSNQDQEIDAGISSTANVVDKPTSTEAHTAHIVKKITRFQCPLCNRKFKYNIILKKHLENHMKISSVTERRTSQIKSPDVLKPMNDSADATLRKLRHKIKCEICSKIFHDEVTFKRHILTTHNIQSNIVNQKLMNSKKNFIHKKPFPCNKCDNSYYQNYNLIRHKRLHHPEVSSKPTVGSCKTRKKFKCIHCDAEYNYRSSLRRHNIRQHLKVIPDPSDGSKSEMKECQVELRNDQSCTGEITDQSTKVVSPKIGDVSQKNHKCDLCDRSYVQVAHLNRHKKTDHAIGSTTVPGGGIKSEVATIGGRVGMSSKFGGYVKKISKKKMSKCQICGRTYDYSRNLRRHMKANHPTTLGPVTPVNTGKDVKDEGTAPENDQSEQMKVVPECPKPQELFSCSICGKRFLYRPSMLQHLQTHETNDSTTLFCNICNRSFTRKHDVYRHKKTVHGISE